MAENMTLEFRGARMECRFARLDALQDSRRVLRTVVLRQKNMIARVKIESHNMVAQHRRRFSDRLPRLEEHRAS